MTKKDVRKELENLGNKISKDIESKKNPSMEIPIRALSNVKYDKSSGQAKKAVKCDMCKDQEAGPACVRACPTGAALRLSPEEFMEIAADRS